MNKILFVITFFFLSFVSDSIFASDGHINIIKIDGIINPIVADFISKSVAKSGEDGAKALIIELDTPGGLDLSMRSIVKEILNSKIPVVVYVYPSGARAASAGVMITMAAHVAAMAPGTNIGAAHPVNLGAGGGRTDETMMEKVVNDAVAYIRSIADKRGRNSDWAEKAVRESVSITAEEAREKKVIDFVAPSLEKLLEMMEGMEVIVGEKKVVLSLAGLDRHEIGMDLRQRILNTISDPNIAYILMMLGFLGLYLELSNPGLILPGVVGGVSLILAFVAFQTLPISYAGVLLIIIGLILLLLEIMIVSYGLLTIGGIACLTIGSLMLFETTAPFLRVSYSVLFPTVAAVSVIFIFVVTNGIRAQRRKIFTGEEGLVGLIGEAREDIERTGKVFVHGELWDAESDEPISRGEKVEVVGVENMVLKVRRIPTTGN